MTKHMTGTCKEWLAARREDGVVYHTYSAYSRGLDGLGHVPVARPRPQGTQRDGWSQVPSPRRVQGLSEVVVVVGPTAGGRPPTHGFRAHVDFKAHRSSIE